MIIPALGGPEQELAEFLDPNTNAFPSLPSASWSADGRWLLVSGRDSSATPNALWLISLENREKRRLTLPPERNLGDFLGAFAPDGRAVAFVRSTAVQTGDLYILPLAADLTARGVPRRLTNDNAVNAGVAWTADGERLVFSSNRGGTPALWRIAISGSNQPERLTVGENGILPSISRQGNRLVYSQSVVDSNIWRVNLSNPRESPAPFIASTRYDYNPQYSPDGKRIAFESNRSGNSEVWVCDADGSNPTQLVAVGRSGSPRWSPDGRWIAFDSNVDGRWQIYVTSAQGGRPRRMTKSESSDTRPSWSPDGLWIYFASNRSKGNPPWQVWKMPSGGGEAVRVTTHGGFAPFPSNDGEAIYFLRNQAHGPLWKVPTKGGEESHVFDSVITGAFAATGAGIYFQSQLGIEYFDFSTSSSRSITTIEKPTVLGLTVSPDGHWLLYSQNDQGGSDLMLVENFR